MNKIAGYPHCEAANASFQKWNPSVLEVLNFGQYPCQFKPSRMIFPVGDSVEITFDHPSTWASTCHGCRCLCANLIDVLLVVAFHYLHIRKLGNCTKLNIANCWTLFFLGDIAIFGVPCQIHISRNSSLLLVAGNQRRPETWSRIRLLV